MSLLFVLSLWFGQQSGDLQRLENMDPKIRLAAATLAGREHWSTAVRPLIRRLKDSAETPEVKAEVLASLAEITGQTDLKDVAAWESWLAKEGAVRFPEQAVNSDEVLRQVDRRLEDRLAQEVSRSEVRVEQAKRDVRIMAVTMAVAIFIFLIVMIFFVGHVSSKIKGWRDLVGRAEVYIKHGQDLTDRTDKIAAELDGKKAEVAEFLEKLRKEHEEGIARRGDDLGQQLAHELRMELQTLRQKAERELGQTVTDLKTQIEASARRAASEVRDRLAK